jgi:nitrite reductase (NADH) large subunit
VRSGLTVERAIVVDDHMHSVDEPDIYVIGECTQHRGRVYGLVVLLFEQAKVGGGRSFSMSGTFK